MVGYKLNGQVSELKIKLHNTWFSKSPSQPLSKLKFFLYYEIKKQHGGK